MATILHFYKTGEIIGRVPDAIAEQIKREYPASPSNDSGAFEAGNIPGLVESFKHPDLRADSVVYAD